MRWATTSWSSHPTGEMSGSSSSMGPMALRRSHHLRTSRARRTARRPRVRCRRAAGDVRDRGLARRLRRTARFRRVGHQPRLQLRPSHVALGHDRRRADCRAMGLLRAGGEHRTWRTASTGRRRPRTRRRRWDRSGAARPARRSTSTCPTFALDEVRGIRYADLAPFNAVRTVITGRSAGRLHVAPQLTELAVPEGTDTASGPPGFCHDHVPRRLWRRRTRLTLKGSNQDSACDRCRSRHCARWRGHRAADRAPALAR